MKNWLFDFEILYFNRKDGDTMEFIEDIKKEEFDKFIKNNKKSHFLQR